ncbi:hypothetical protein GUITHDRAFT_122160 [Guillardia theta CCMP2712]|uniref:PDZ domain-containing protein n=2 Tax=Guillardia theta TaxID=55529 RepID=L1I704_GUITC|nr:hypothetical protein GUITHDRAFT_122160 [Guillardia theta CCMP2712]EKX31650.1 hypothetical protein GUITHDRAFT_122160 [Guillardia theta CCMP2712]|eukprot:XP_005818630.1 hypothetical protein GUITHDRAFT_122160 [Guillardia theta CCMP2712]
MLRAAAAMKEAEEAAERMEEDSDMFSSMEFALFGDDRSEGSFEPNMPKTTLGMVVTDTEIESIIPGGPAFLARLQSSDKIVEINHQSVHSYNDVQRHLCSSDVPGEKVKLLIERRNHDHSASSFEAELVRFPVAKMRRVSKIFRILTIIADKEKTNMEDLTEVMRGVEEILLRDYSIIAQFHLTRQNIRSLKEKISIARKCLLEETDCNLKELSSFNLRDTNTRLERIEADEEALDEISLYFTSIMAKNNMSQREELSNLLDVATQAHHMFDLKTMILRDEIKKIETTRQIEQEQEKNQNCLLLP